MTDRVAIAGIGHTAYGKLPGRTPWSLQAEAVAVALADAGLTRDDVDGLATESHFSEPMMMHGVALGRMLGLRPRYLTTQAQGGATCASLVQTSAMAIANGLCDVAVVVYGDNAKTGVPNIYGLAQIGRGLADDVAYGMAGGPVMEARAAMRYMHDTGCTHKMLGAVAVTERAHASRTPHAQYRAPLTMDDYLGSRWIAEPFRLYDCTIASDGGAAIVLTSAERARDLAKPPVLLSGFGQAHNLDGLRDRTHYTTFAGARSSRHAYAMAGIGPDDVDVAELYDCFTSTVLVTLEDYGFCGRGEAGPLAADGGLGTDGKIPTNTSGGMLSEANAGGWNHVVEAVRQLRGEASNQVAGAEVAVVSGHGGFQQTHATLVLRRAQ